MSDVLERLEAQILFDTAGSGCWLWTASLTANGYGRFKFRGRAWKAHRVAWTLYVGEIPDGLVLDHLCRVRCCVNPSHLRVCTQRENTLAPGSEALAKIQTLRTHCPRNHRLVAPNLQEADVRRGQRTCRACAIARRRVLKASLRGEELDLVTVADRVYARWEIAS